jgi:hypothetical protein
VRRLKSSKFDGLFTKSSSGDELSAIDCGLDSKLVALPTVANGLRSGSDCGKGIIVTSLGSPAVPPVSIEVVTAPSFACDIAGSDTSTDLRVGSNGVTSARSDSCPVE